MFIFKKILKFLFNLALVAGLIFLFFWARDHKLAMMEKFQELASPLPINKLASEENLPEQSGGKELVYTWKYAGKKYELKETLFDSAYKFYQKSQKVYKYQGEAPVDWEDQYYALFFNQAQNDDSISRIANDLKNLGEKNKLSEDQIIEMILAFVQSIPYDDTKADIILSTGEESINYPYETLFENKGVCSDKSILGAAILRKLGYGVALFTYEAEKHMSLGIKCPQEYSNYQTGYCYAETTSTGFRVGMIPDFDQNNRVIANQELKTFEQTQLDQFNVKRLGEARMFQATEGKTYAGISKTLAAAKEIDSLKINIQSLGKQINEARNRIEGQQNDLSDLQERMKRLRNENEFDEYNDLVGKYNKMADNYRADVKKYNAMITSYNQKVSRYNILIKNF